VTKQTEKLVDVIKVDDFRDEQFVDRELVLMRVDVTPETRSEVLQICDVFRAKIVDVRLDKLVIEITGNESKVTKFINLMQHFGIAEITRTGKVALSRTADTE